MIALIAALIIGVFIGLIIGSAVAAGKAEDSLKRMRLEFLEHDKDLRARIDAVNAIASFTIETLKQEARESKAALEAEKRARLRDREQPAGWGEEPAGALPS